MPHDAPPKQKTCPRCGDPFTCGGNTCWCAAVPLSPAQREELRHQYQDCLCPQCLRDLAASAPSPDANKKAPR